MKKVCCLIFVVLLFLSSNLFIRNEISDVFDYFDHINYIKAVVDESYYSKYSGVFNGNKLILDINKEDLQKINYDGITIKIDNKNFNLVKFMQFFDIKVDKKYKINKVDVIDGISNKLKVNGKTTIQIVISNNEVIVGIPMILNSF